MVESGNDCENIFGGMATAIMKNTGKLKVFIFITCSLAMEDVFEKDILMKIIKWQIGGKEQ
jgi:hypothetical protein